MAPAQSSDALSVIGFFLTLVGLLGTFFYIHLSDWYREVSALAVKWEINKFGDDPDQKKGRRECRYEAEKIASWSTLITSGVVTFFVLFVTLLSIILWLAEPDKSDAWIYIGVAGLGFLGIYLVMTFGFVVAGYYKAIKVRLEVRKKMPLTRKK